ncbi:3'-5' exonuclease [Herbiconiux moechotypicola]|uniref:Exonuclease domain-containing protein n=1 Tax=Herbiconiux moechotypicola TaxID=637393 RepID=A0ABN3E7U3_9MICO|nr:3'-5' exonuclease [Herbiconiux moechotypicola]MCS5730725.1 3'-5' exonuclease [Herbiconiux moechotypicola]
MSPLGFATIDFETTGLSSSDRVVELAVVHSDPDGTVTGRWDTLVDPQRPPGPTHIHRITSSALRGAPLFGDVAPGLLARLSGRVVVAHNAGFDLRFLHQELARIGYPPASGIVSLCTARLSRQFLPTGRRSLAALCEVFAIELTDAHRALSDAVATAELLAAFIAHSPSRAGWAQLLQRAASRRLAPAPGTAGGETPWRPRPDGRGGQSGPGVQGVQPSRPLRPAFA